MTGAYAQNDGVESGDLDFSASPDRDDRGTYSDTNVHIAGVDEADVAKYDGSHWFVAYQPNYSSGELPGVQIIATEPDIPNASITATYRFEDVARGAASSLYLMKENAAASYVVALRGPRGYMGIDLPGWNSVDFSTEDMSLWSGSRSSELSIEFIDVTQPATPILADRILLDGALIDSRRVGNRLYVITRFDPWLESLQFESFAEQARSNNELVLSRTELADLLPQYRQGELTAPLNTSCYAPSNTQPEHGFISIINITAIDLNARQVLSSECLSTDVSSMTMNSSALYLTANDRRDTEVRTIIHKFTLSEIGANYSAMARVPGSIRGDAPYRINEYNGDLRVVTTRGEWDQPSHHLSILRQSGSGFDTVAELPNSERPGPIGKPEEDIYAVRFAGPTAYVVTYRRIDPLYVLDLSDREDPKISGELEVPGFATYIHPLNDDYLFTLGQDADSQSGWAQGIKAQLVKVTGGVPELVGEALIGDRFSHSEALYDLRALTVLMLSDSNARISFPVSVYGSDAGDYSQWQYSGLQMLELSGLKSAQGATHAAMQNKGVLIAEAGTNGHYDYNGGVRRGLLHNDAVLYAHDNNIWFSRWGAAEAPQKLGDGEPIACDTQYVYGLEITVRGSPLHPIDYCEAEVIAVDGDYSEVLSGDYRNSLDACVFYGAGERPGNYDLKVSLSGYESQALENVVVSQDICHVQPQLREFQLSPAAEAP
ncbi:beta-propeller domain-containing protein [Gilvimarinus chinensis]|uniref:beta-propeller domain-containing protein n=1 Tax=Gilvimarinus chinensis TaxID=396005 RepID=UPI000360D80C|nr:beta-propeller domain-containing protein [Gilvimarinus chinensis]